MDKSTHCTHVSAPQYTLVHTPGRRYGGLLQVSAFHWHPVDGEVLDVAVEVVLAGSVRPLTIHLNVSTLDVFGLINTLLTRSSSTWNKSINNYGT